MTFRLRVVNRFNIISINKIQRQGVISVCGLLRFVITAKQTTG